MSLSGSMCNRNLNCSNNKNNNAVNILGLDSTGLGIGLDLAKCVLLAVLLYFQLCMLCVARNFVLFISIFFPVKRNMAFCFMPLAP